MKAKTQAMDVDGWNMGDAEEEEREEPQEQEQDTDIWSEKAIQEMGAGHRLFRTRTGSAPGAAYAAPMPQPLSLQPEMACLARAPPKPKQMGMGGAVFGGIASAAAAVGSALSFGSRGGGGQLDGCTLAGRGPAAAMRKRAAPAPVMAAQSACLAGAVNRPAQEAAFGFRTGGAQDVCNLRENVKQGYLPLVTDVTFEGIAKDYFFDMSPIAERGDQEQERCTDLFFPTYSLALAPDPLLAAASSSSSPTATVAAQPHRPDIFLSMGLDSGMTEFRRPQLNLVILLDISGSMHSPFNSYYYDGATGQRRELAAAERSTSKMCVAKEVVLGMLDKLTEKDSVGIVLFNYEACTPKPLGSMRTAKLDTIKAGVNALSANGGTNLQAGMDAAVAQFRRYSGFRTAEPMTTESRMVIITDAEPNAGDFSDTGLIARLKANALDGIHTTFVGVGLDFNTQLIEDISKVKGANYYSVHSPGEFKQRLCDDFDCMVSPLVFDLALRLDRASLEAGWKILHAYGSPNPQETALSEDGTVMKVHTLFPSPKTEEGIKGGVVLLRMKAPAAEVSGASPPAPLTVSVTYRDRSGQPFASNKEVPLPGWALGAAAAGAEAGEGAGGAGPAEAAEAAEGLFQSTGIRKAVALARYVDALQSWLVDQRASGGVRVQAPVGYLERFGAGNGTHNDFWLGAGQCLLPPPPQLAASGTFGATWERTSRKLEVSPRAKEAFVALLPWMRREVEALGDGDMKQEVELLERLVAA